MYIIFICPLLWALQYGDYKIKTVDDLVFEVILTRIDRAPLYVFCHNTFLLSSLLNERHLVQQLPIKLYFNDVSFLLFCTNESCLENSYTFIKINKDANI
ncbi:hypothetical protein V1477_002718 [Vespula maculifrons]|uniref:Uncharacterized protein n=1 Tax=Vespula maculifrons TaxID=7453 RepID=A0ABD2CVE4_VESMC